MATKQNKKTWASTKRILLDVQLPEYVSKFLTDKEAALLKYILAEMDIRELRKVYKCKPNQLQLEIVMDILALGHRLAEIAILENKILIDWNKTNKPGYLEGFLDCKNQVKGVIHNGLRKKSGR
jgi:hypothetical protein